jgi:hypothetical protein
MPDLDPTEDGYLFLVVDKQFYAVTKQVVKDHAILIPGDDGSDPSELLNSLVEEGFVLADIAGPGESSVRPDSCACIALNIDKFDDRIAQKQRNINALRNARTTAKAKRPKASKAKRR